MLRLSAAAAGVAALISLFATTTPAPLPTPEEDRLLGPTHAATAVEVALAGFPAGPQHVYLAGSVVDALLAGSLPPGPVFLAPGRVLDPTVRDYLVRTSPVTVTLVGGEATVKDTIAAEVEALGLSVTRLGGANRIETAAAVARAAFPDGATVAYLAATAHAGGPPTADLFTAGTLPRGPVLLIDSNVGLTPSTAALLAELGVTETVQLGGRSFPGMAPTRRLAGPDRATTSVVVAEEAFPTAPLAYIVAYDDALTAAAANALPGGPVLLVPRTKLPDSTCAYLQSLAPTRVQALGGPTAVPSEVLASAQACAKP